MTGTYPVDMWTLLALFLGALTAIIIYGRIEMARDRRRRYVILFRYEPLRLIKSPTRSLHVYDRAMDIPRAHVHVRLSLYADARLRAMAEEGFTNITTDA